MRRLYLNIFLLIVLILLLSQVDSSSVLSISPIVISTPTPTQTPTPMPTQAPPSRLIVPKLDIDSSLEPVGVEANGQMQTPSSFSGVGWYVKSAKPGERGTAVIDGHFDDVGGQPAIFYNLKQLVPGDEIIIIDQSGNELKFMINEIAKYPAETAVEDLYKKDNGKNLILITCAGWWNNSVKMYSHRLVVYSVLK